MGIPWVHYGIRVRYMGSKRISSCLCPSFLFSTPGNEYVTPTHVLSQDGPVLAVIRDHDPRLGSLGEDFLTELTGSASLDGVEVRVDPAMCSDGGA